VAIFREWLKALPDGVVRARPRLRLFASRVFYVIGQREKTERILQELEESIHDDSTIPDADAILGSVVADRASYAAVRGDVQQAIELAHRALTYLPEDAMLRMRVSVTLGLAYFRAGNVSEAGRAFSQAISAATKANLGFLAAPLFCNLAEVQIVQGQLRQAFQTCQQAMEMAIVGGMPTSMAGFPGLELGKILYERNDLSEAERYVSESLDLLGRSGTTDSFGIGHALLARIRQAQGDDDGALVAIQRAIQIAQDFDLARVTTLIGAHQARIWLAQDQLELAAGWAREYEKLGETEFLREFEDLTLVRVLLAQDKPAEASALLATLQTPAEAAGRIGTVIEISALRALALQALADIDRAMQALKRALQLAEPEGYARVFIDEEEPMAHLLRQSADLGIAPSYVGQLLAVLDPDRRERPAIDMSSLVEPLSDRELEVLDLLADGLTNPEIARRLYISLPTVKSHTRNIYGKLDVHTRTDAVARARKLGILPS
jgi:LuxR family maltose regulon positive regulatory protein